MRKCRLFMAMALLCTCLTAISQTFTATGKVTDDKGSPVNGASVRERGSQRGMTANISGTFSLLVKQGATLIVSAVGFETKETPAGSNITVTLNPDIKGLSEVVVTGIGVATSKRKVAVAVESINISNQVKVPSGDVGQQLVGQVAGAQISSTNGSPGAPLNILLRGINTVQSGTSPMILIDGIEARATSLTSLDLNTIDHVEIVQGAAAASLYGAQGANGVIQLFTKRSRNGRINIDVSSSASTNELLNVGNQRKAMYHAFVTDAAGNVVYNNSAGVATPILFDSVTSSFNANVQYDALSPTSYANKPYGQNLKYYDHYKMFFQKGYALNNSISINGNSDRMDFLVAASDNRQNSNFKNNGDYERSNVTANLGFEVFKNLRFRSITQMVYTQNTLNDATGRGIVYALNNTRPFADYDYRDKDGNYGYYFGSAAGVNGSNPNFVNQYSSTKDNKIDVIQNLSLNYRFPKFVELDAKYGLNYETQNIVYRYEDQEDNKNAVAQRVYLSNYNPNSSGDGSTTGEIDNITNRTTFQNFIGTATIRTDFDKDFHVKIPLRTTTLVAFDYRKRYYTRFYSYGYDAPTYTPWNASQAGVYKVLTDYVEPFITYGFLANQRFEYGDLAGASIGIRSDYSSAFGRGGKAQNFPRGDAFFNVSQIGFWKNGSLGKTFTDFKLRAGYGEAGIQPGAFQRFPALGAANLGTKSVFTFPLTNPNPDLTVEISKELEMGTDMGFTILKDGAWLKNAGLSFTYWDRKTKNAIYAVDAPPSTGIGTILNNAFGLASHGVQASLNLSLLRSRNFTWDMTTNFSKQTSYIASTNGAQIVVTSSAGSSNYILRAGDKIGQLFGFIILKSVDQIEPSTGQPVIPKASQGDYEVASNGYVVNKTTKRPIGTVGQYSLGDPNPKFNMSFINNFSFKGIVSISMQWDWVHGAHLYNQTKGWMYRDGIHADYENPITINGETQAYTAFYRGIYQVGANNATKSYFYEDASFTRLRNLSAAIDFGKLFKIPKMQRLQLVLSGRNLITYTKYTGMDPEVSSGTSNSAFDRGVDHNTIPNTRAYTVGLNVGL